MLGTFRDVQKTVLAAILAQLTIPIPSTRSTSFGLAPLLLDLSPNISDVPPA